MSADAVLKFNLECRTWEEEAYALPDSPEEVIPPLYMVDEGGGLLWHPYLDNKGQQQKKVQWSASMLRWAASMEPAIPLLRAIRRRDWAVSQLLRLDWSRVEVHSCRRASGSGGGDFEDRLPTRDEVLEGFVMDTTWWNPGPYFNTILTEGDPDPWDFLDKPGMGHFSQPVLTRVGHVQIRFN